MISHHFWVSYRRDLFLQLSEALVSYHLSSDSDKLLYIINNNIVTVLNQQLM